MTNIIKKLWAMLPYPITHLGQCMNTSYEWHIWLHGISFPACRIWGMRLDKEQWDVIKDEGHYFVAGVLLSTVVLFIAIGAFIVLIIRIT